jgi:hypothetical protein
VTLTDESKSIGLFLNRLSWFYWYRENPDGTVRQDAIFYDSVLSPNGLTEVFCEPGDETCAFNTILIAPFFDRIGVVSGTGEAVCQFGGNLDCVSEVVIPQFDCGDSAIQAGTAITFAGTTITGGDAIAGTAITGITTFVDGEIVTTPLDVDALSIAVNLAWEAAMEVRDDATDIASEMGSLTFTAGTWRAGILTIVAGATVTLDGQDDPDSVFLFQSDANMLVGAGCTIALVNGAKAENVVWALGTLLSAGSDVDFQGSILAATAITFGATTVVQGSVVAANGAITFGASNDVTGCVVAAIAPITFGAGNSVTVGLPPPSRTLRSRKLLVKSAQTNRNSPSSFRETIVSKNMKPLVRALQEEEGPADALNRFEIALNIIPGAEAYSSAFLASLSVPALLASSFALSFALFP